MKFRLLRLLTFSILAFNIFPIFAQEESDKNDYKAEIGIIGGASYYIGDASSTYFNYQNIKSALGGFFRYRIDNRIAVKGELISTDIAGSGIENQVFAGDIVGEYNFFDLEQDPYKRLSKIYSPYILLGIGLMNYDFINSTGHTSLIFGNTTNPSLVFGLGMKLKLGNRLNLNLQWSNRMLLADDLEGDSKYNNTNNLNGLNIFNNDFVSGLTIGISFDIWKKECNCMNLHQDK